MTDTGHNTGRLSRAGLRGLSRYISGARRPVTVLFTDIEDSTRFWDRRGDVDGRLMVDRHNRVLFPVIEGFRGRVVKTIGDSVMASFPTPELGLRAAIGMQQALEQARAEDREFRIQVRIGLHSGDAIVERKDVFGDVVNVAARIEGKAAGGQILLSGSTAARLDKRLYALSKKTSFVPKGKRRAVPVWACDWKRAPDQLTALRPSRFTTYLGGQQRLVGLYALGTALAIYGVYRAYLRYMIADSEAWALFALDPLGGLLRHPGWSSAVGSVLCAALGLALWKGRLSYLLLRSLRGGLGFTVGLTAALLICLGISQTRILRPTAYWHEALFESRHLFVEIESERAPVREEASKEAAVLREVRRGKLLLLADVRERSGVTWNKVLLGPGLYGWVPRVLPAEIGVPERRLSRADKFYLRYRDLYVLGAAMLGFIWGFWGFRLRPI